MRFASIKTLMADGLTLGQATQLRGLVKGDIDPMSYQSVQDWLRQCYNLPRTFELIMEAADEVLGTYGAELLDDAQAHYLNTGDTYAPTLVYQSGRFTWADLGTIAERCYRDDR